MWFRSFPVRCVHQFTPPPTGQKRDSSSRQPPQIEAQFRFYRTVARSSGKCAPSRFWIWSSKNALALALVCILIWPCEPFQMSSKPFHSLKCKFKWGLSRHPDCHGSKHNFFGKYLCVDFFSSPKNVYFEGENFALFAPSHQKTFYIWLPQLGLCQSKVFSEKEIIDQEIKMGVIDRENGKTNV